MDPSLIIIFAIAIGAMWLMSNRTRKQQRAAMSFRDNLQPGQEVQTGSGLLGTVVSVEDGVVTLETAPGMETRWVIAAIARLVEPPVEDEDDELADDEDVEDEWDDEADDADAIDEDETIEVPDDLSTLPPARGDDGSEDTSTTQK
ncbi:MAG TPA: preprotein translocase subunit YajC [Friedmanniella sp.]